MKLKKLNVKCNLNLDVREENKALKYKIELMSIDKNDTGVQFESRFITIRNYLVDEPNSFNEFLADLGYDYIYHRFKYLIFN